jgi:type IV secretory pathway protease TraF
MALAVAAVAAATIPPFQAQLICNVSPSVPVGFYRLAPGAPMRGDLAVVQLPVPLRAFADARGYLPRSFLLLKPVAAKAGDFVCRLGPRLWISGRGSVPIRTADGLGRPLLAWRGCGRLNIGQVFLLSPAPGSYDSRYFGPLETGHVVGTAIPLFTFTDRREVP